MFQPSSSPKNEVKILKSAHLSAEPRMTNNETTGQEHSSATKPSLATWCHLCRMSTTGSGLLLLPFTSTSDGLDTQKSWPSGKLKHGSTSLENCTIPAIPWFFLEIHGKIHQVGDVPVIHVELPGGKHQSVGGLRLFLLQPSGWQEGWTCRRNLEPRSSQGVKRIIAWNPWVLQPRCWCIRTYVPAWSSLEVWQILTRYRHHVVNSTLVVNITEPTLTHKFGRETGGTNFGRHQVEHAPCEWIKPFGMCFIFWWL